MTYAVLAVFVFVYGYVAYTAIAISRALSNRVYRNQALGLAGVALVIVELALIDIFGPGANYVPSPIVDAIQLLLIWFAIFLGFFYYVDASIRAARPSDPLFRDTLYWTRLRVAFWAYDIGAAIVFPVAAAFNSYDYASGGTPAFFQAEIPALIVLFSGVVVLPLAIRKSKDKVLKTQLRWFAIYMIWLVLLFTGLVSNAPTAVELVIFLAGAYALYRSATSLVPLYKFNREPTKST